MNTITFDQASKRFILDLFDKTVNNEGLIVERINPKQLVLTKDGEFIEEAKFAGIKKGSLIFIKNDIISLIDFCDSLE